MSRSPCPRSFEAEAMRDGRLVGAERASFERHLSSCATCARETQALEALAEALRASVGPANANELHARRERTRLLAAFDRALLAPEGRGGLRGPVWVGLVATIVVGAVVFGRGRLAPQAAHAVIRADPMAVWSERAEGDRENVVLERGTLSIRVDHTSGGGGLVVHLPDGELEDVGTIFDVGVDAGHTTRVAVEEGRVVLRLRGRPAVTLDAGQSWIADVPAPDASASATSSPSKPPKPPMALPAAAASSGPLRPMPPPAPPVIIPDPLADFRGAAAALDVGDNHRAAAGFATFLERHPRDPRAEDAAYLRVVALQRCGDGAGMKEAAQDYLGRYPAGFRRAEVEALSR